MTEAVIGVPDAVAVVDAFLGAFLRVAGGRIARLWMVDAKPAESDAFWD